MRISIRARQSLDTVEVTHVKAKYVFLIGLDVDRCKTAGEDLYGYFMRLFGVVLRPCM